MNPPTAKCFQFMRNKTESKLLRMYAKPFGATENNNAEVLFVLVRKQRAPDSVWHVSLGTFMDNPDAVIQTQVSLFCGARPFVERGDPEVVDRPGKKVFTGTFEEALAYAEPYVRML